MNDREIHRARYKVSQNALDYIINLINKLETTAELNVNERNEIFGTIKREVKMIQWNLNGLYEKI